ncbi:MAG: dTDP-4-dehydrorhamnose 3,5-epimerase [Candidatus Zixiibacteriota bacterium]|nr:MAG: dTDP-4-dehydrorhamnose 3,5-epimerase [candidate division Zixibacteria bacterium]
MTFSATRLDGVFLIETVAHPDNRGCFMETYVKREFEEHGITAEFVQDNYSFTKLKNTIRGMHFQMNPHAQAKLIRVVRGSILSVVVDIRKGSPTYGQWLATPLSGNSKSQIFVPRGFANGYCTTVDETEICYKVDNYYAPRFDRAFRWDDPDIAVDWPTADPILSGRDRKAPALTEVDNNFAYRAK